jgi:hypothetical protein
VASRPAGTVEEDDEGHALAGGHHLRRRRRRRVRLQGAARRARTCARHVGVRMGARVGVGGRALARACAPGQAAGPPPGQAAGSGLARAQTCPARARACVWACVHVREKTCARAHACAGANVRGGVPRRICARALGRARPEGVLHPRARRPLHRAADFPAGPSHGPARQRERGSGSEAAGARLRPRDGRGPRSTSARPAGLRGPPTGRAGPLALCYALSGLSGCVCQCVRARAGARARGRAPRSVLAQGPRVAGYVPRNYAAPRATVTRAARADREMR